LAGWFPQVISNGEETGKISPEHPVRKKDRYEVNEMSQLMKFRKQKDNFFAKDPHSPLSQEQRDTFMGLEYFPENPELRLVMEIKRFDDPEAVQIQTSTGEVQPYTKYGRLDFEVEGEEASLILYIGKDGHPFVPFGDATNAKETYGAGRYLEPDELGDEKFLVDFNLAYNPWCAYSPDYSCPLPPEENQLSVPIRAGEMTYPG
jgi:uncharacterized protein (DUF1684 family)